MHTHGNGHLMAPNRSEHIGLPGECKMDPAGNPMVSSKGRG